MTRNWCQRTADKIDAAIDGTLAIARKHRGTLIGTGIGVAAIVGGNAQGGSTYTPVDVLSVTFPVSPASIVDTVLAAGGTILSIGFPIMIGFGLVWKLVRMIGRG